MEPSTNRTSPAVALPVQVGSQECRVLSLIRPSEKKTAHRTPTVGAFLWSVASSTLPGWGTSWCSQTEARGRWLKRLRPHAPAAASFQSRGWHSVRRRRSTPLRDTTPKQLGATRSRPTLPALSSVRAAIASLGSRIWQRHRHSARLCWQKL
eukprot:SAG11_NODE_546_length_8609_cov_2.338778_2_plen_152_part_00